MYVYYTAYAKYIHVQLTSRNVFREVLLYVCMIQCVVPEKYGNIHTCNWYKLKVITSDNCNNKKRMRSIQYMYICLHDQNQLERNLETLVTTCTHICNNNKIHSYHSGVHSLHHSLVPLTYITGTHSAHVHNTAVCGTYTLHVCTYIILHAIDQQRRQCITIHNVIKSKGCLVSHWSKIFT